MGTQLWKNVWKHDHEPVDFSTPFTSGIPLMAISRRSPKKAAENMVVVLRMSLKIRLFRHFLVGGFSHPNLKNMSSSIGMIRNSQYMGWLFPIYTYIYMGKSKKMATKPPTSFFNLQILAMERPSSCGSQRTLNRSPCRWPKKVHMATVKDIHLTKDVCACAWGIYTCIYIYIYYIVYI